MKKIFIIGLLTINTVLLISAMEDEINKVESNQILLNNQLVEAARNGHADLVKELLEKGIDANIKDKYGSTSLHEAAGKGHKEVVELLLASGADENSQDNHSRTPLHFAVNGGYIETVESLIAAGAKVDSKDEASATPLHYAAMHGDEKVAKKLIEGFITSHASDSNEEKLKKLQEFIAIESEIDETAKTVIDIVDVVRNHLKNDDIFKYITVIENASSYDDLNEDLKI